MFQLTSFLVALVVTFWYMDTIASENVYSSLPVCKVKNSNVNECLLTFLQRAIKHSQRGSKEYSIPPLDPYFVPKVTMSSTKNMGVNIELKNSTTHGFSKAILSKVKADPERGFFEIHYVLPVSTILSHYNLTGKIFSVPINGQGKSNITFYDVMHEVKIKGDIVDDLKTNSKRYAVSSVSMRLKPKKMKFHFDKLFKENKELGDIVNQMMNDNWQDIFARLQPKMEEDMSKHSHQLLSDFFQTVAYDKIFPDV